MGDEQENQSTHLAHTSVASELECQQVVTQNECQITLAPKKTKSCFRIDMEFSP